MIGKMKKGNATGGIVVVLIIVIFALVYLNYMQGDEKAKDIFNRFKCPEIDSNLNCDFGIDLYLDNTGCTTARCKSTNVTDTGLPENSLQIFFVDVGQGDGIYIETPEEKHVVIDAGRGSAMNDFLIFKGINKLDWVILTHPDADHIGGIDDLFDNFVVLNYLTPEIECDTQICARVEESEVLEEGLNISLGRTGFEFNGLDLDWEILSPDDLIYDTDNDNSIVIKLSYGDVSFLFTGDCEEDCEDMMLTFARDVQATVLKVGHHGGSSATSAKFLAEVNPAYAILSYGDTNPYGHPSRTIIDRLIKQDVHIIRTATAGDIEVRTDGTELEFYCEKKEDCFS